MPLSCSSKLAGRGFSLAQASVARGRPLGGLQLRPRMGSEVIHARRLPRLHFGQRGTGRFPRETAPEGSPRPHRPCVPPLRSTTGGCRVCGTNSRQPVHSMCTQTKQNATKFHHMRSPLMRNQHQRQPRRMKSLDVAA